MDGDKRCPFPAFPQGGCCVDFSETLKPCDIHSRRLFGRDPTPFRTARGAQALVEATCSHMGADTATGGCREGGTVECPKTQLEQLEAALAVFGKRMKVTIQEQGTGSAP